VSSTWWLQAQLPDRSLRTDAKHLSAAVSSVDVECEPCNLAEHAKCQPHGGFKLSYPIGVCERTRSSSRRAMPASAYHKVTIVNMVGEQLTDECRMRSHNKVCYLYDQVCEILNLSHSGNFALATKSAKKLDDMFAFFRICVTDEEWFESVDCADYETRPIIITLVKQHSSNLAEWKGDPRHRERRAVAADVEIDTGDRMRFITFLQGLLVAPDGAAGTTEAAGWD
jgi:hypothetical protein